MTDKLKNWIKNPQVWGSIVAIAAMALVSLAFFYPDNFEGNSLRQADMQQGAANGQEALEYYEQTGEKALWTNSLFGGMPTFQISPSYESNKLFTWINTLYGLGLPSPSNLLFMMMFGFYILLIVMGLRWYYALIGAMTWGLSSYFIIIIGAGHIWKFLALSYVPPTIAGVVLCYRGRYLLGAAFTALFAMMQLNANHPQMSYYFAFVMAALAIAWLVEAIREKQIKRWLIASAVVLGAGGLALGANVSSLYNTYEYSKVTKRSQSELTPLTSNDNPAERPTGGMPYSQIIGWSYGQSETLSLLIPNIKGGATARAEGGGMVYMGLDRLDDAKEYQNQAVNDLLPYLPQYFNNSEGTNGPVYVGAIIFALFLMGCVVVKGPVKWALLISTILSIMLAWGANFAWFTDLMIYHFPLYNKFRAVESILVIAQFAMPLLGILALKEVLEQPNTLKQHATKLYISFGFCILVCLMAIVAPSIFGDAITAADRAQVAQVTQQVQTMAQQYGYSAEQVQQISYHYSLSNPDNVAAIESLRYGLLSADAWRSLFLVLVVANVLLMAMAGKLRKTWAIAIIGVLAVVDLYNVDKRYVSHDSFVAVSPDAPEFVPDAVDQKILADTTIYRILDIPGFQNADRSYFHHRVGGYHAAKLNRMEDLIQRRLGFVNRFGYIPELRDDSIVAQMDADQQSMAHRLASVYRTLDMLNTKYIITGDETAPVMLNTSALGNAWFVDSINYVDNADAEMAALDALNPAFEAVADKQFADVLPKPTKPLALGDYIQLDKYTPNQLTYTAVSENGGIGVFSEVWFPWGWKATIDDKPAPIGRVNYILRAISIPAGTHQIVMTFDPDSLHVSEAVAYASVSIIYLLVLLAAFVEYRRKDNDSQVV